MLFDDVLREIGEFGPYQKKVYLLAALPSIAVAFETLSVIFIFFIPDHRCKIPGFDQDTWEIQNETHSLLVEQTIPRTNGKWDQCHVFADSVPGGTFWGNSSTNGSNDDVNSSRPIIGCDSWVYDRSTFDATIATDFNTVCKKTWLRANSNMISEIGALLGMFVIGFIADRFGRKVAFNIGGVVIVGGGFGIAFVDNMIALNVCRFLLGVARMSVFINGFIIGMELLGPSKRTYAGMYIELVWCFGEFLLLGFALVFRNWRFLEIAVSVPCVALLFYWWLIPESPRWLASRGRDSEALAILERIAASNKTRLPDTDVTGKLLEAEDQLSIRHALRSKQLMLRIFIVLSYVFVSVVGYYGLTLNISNLTGSVYLNYGINVFMEMLSYLLALYLLRRVGRKIVCFAFMLLAGAACLLSALPILLGLPAWTLMVLSTVGRFALCITFASSYVYGAEVFPTVVRSSAMGVCVSLSRLGSIVAPYIADIGKLVGGRFQDALPLLVMGSPTLVVAMLVLLLPETNHAILPDTIEDLERSKLKARRLCCISGKGDKNNSSETKEDPSTTRC